MANRMKTSLIIRKETLYDKIRKKLFHFAYGEDYQMIQRLDKLMELKRPQESKIVIPKEMRKDFVKL